MAINVFVRLDLLVFIVKLKQMIVVVHHVFPVNVLLLSLSVTIVFVRKVELAFNVNSE
jgi:hypothetical protein